MRTSLRNYGKRALYQMFRYCIRQAIKDITLYEQIEALRDSAAFVREHLAQSRGFRDQREIMDFALSQVSVAGAYLEFGVFRGESLNYIAQKMPDTTVHGFDSFVGLPEDWRPGYPRGMFKINDVSALSFAPNVEIHRGWFSESLPAFTKSLTQDIAFLHVDSDLYSSAVDIFWWLRDRLIKGSVILFDEYYNHPGWREGEHKAFCEFAESTGRKFRYIAHNLTSEQVAVALD